MTQEVFPRRQTWIMMTNDDTLWCGCQGDESNLLMRAYTRLQIKTLWMAPNIVRLKILVLEKMKAVSSGPRAKISTLHAYYNVIDRLSLTHSCFQGNSHTFFYF